MPLLEIFRIPVLVGVLTAIGLVAALVGDGAWDLLSWLALAIPLAVIGWGLARREVTEPGRTGLFSSWQKPAELPDALFDARVEHVLERLHERGRKELPSLIRYFLRRSIPLWGVGRRLTEVEDRDMTFLRDKLLSLDPEKCRLCYLLCRAIQARRVVEVGTSFGVSTIYLAAAVRDTVGSSGGTGLVIGTEIDPAKVAKARENLAAAGLLAFVEVRTGDARATLKDPGGAIDFVLIDTWIPLARPVLEMLAPHLRTGAIVLCDNVGRFRRDYADYLAYVRDPANGFRSILVSHNGGAEISLRVSS